MSARDTGFVPCCSRGSGRPAPLREEQPSVRWPARSACARTPAPTSVPVTIHSAPCTDTDFCDGRKGSLIYLGIKGTNLSLCCEDAQGQPTLQVRVSGRALRGEALRGAVLYVIGHITE